MSETKELGYKYNKSVLSNRGHTRAWNLLGIRITNYSYLTAICYNVTPLKKEVSILTGHIKKIADVTIIYWS